MINKHDVKESSDDDTMEDDKYDDELAKSAKSERPFVSQYTKPM